MTFGQFLKSLRERHGVSPADLAMRAGLDTPTVECLEQDKLEPTWEQVEKLAKAVGVDVRTFLPKTSVAIEEDTSPGLAVDGAAATPFREIPPAAVEEATKPEGGAKPVPEEHGKGHGFTHAEIAYGAFCIYEEEKRRGRYSGQDAHWFAAIDRLTRIRARAKATPDGPKTCYMCDRPPTSVEHVPPRCFFPEQKDLQAGVDYRKGLLTVPSCDIHNSDKSKDDVYLLAVIAAYYANNQPSKDHYGTKILRALQKSTGFAHCVLTGSEKVSFGGDTTTALKVDTIRFLRGLTNVAHGLYFHTYGTRCPHPVQVHTTALHGADKLPRADVAGLIGMVRPVLSSAALLGENPDIVQYQTVQVPQTPMTVIRMLFYQGVEVLALIGPGFHEVA